MNRPVPVPLHVLTGFLGAGKSTLLNRWLKDPALARTLVLINEFGEIALDHLLVEAAADDIVLLPSGCVCCAVRGDLVAALETILRKRDNGRIALFDRVILETTGLADPAPVLAAILNHPYLKLRFSIAGIWAAVDAVNGLQTLASHPVAVQQAALADVLLITKTDLVDAATVASLHAQLTGLNPLALIQDAPAAGLEQLLAAGATTTDTLRVFPAADALAPSHGVQSFTLTSDEPVRAESFDLFLSMLRAQKGPNLLRVKGLLSLHDDPDAPVVIHAVQHMMHPVQRLARWPDADRRTRLVFIVRDIDPAFVAALWDAFHGQQTGTITAVP